MDELYPDLLAEANAQAEQQANPTTGLRELAARISSRLSSGGFPEVEVDHATALLNPTESGKHHPDNLQLLIKAHNGA